MLNQIVLHNVSKCFHNAQVLDVDTVSITRGEIVALIGQNGAGKSTFIKIVSGLLIQDRGTVDVFGVANTRKEIHRIVQFVLESGGGYYQYLTAKQNIEYFLKLNHSSYKEKRSQIMQLEQLFDFEPFHERLVGELSQGNRQKLSLIMALLYETPVLCLDEPTNGLDARSKEKLAELLARRARSDGLTVLCTTHDREFIQQCVTRFIVLKGGHIARDERLCGQHRKTLQNFEERYTITLYTDELRRHRQNLPLLNASLSNGFAQIEERLSTDDHTKRQQFCSVRHEADCPSIPASSNTLSVITTVRKEVKQELVSTCDILALDTSVFEVDDLLERLVNVSKDSAE